MASTQKAPEQNGSSTGVDIHTNGTRDARSAEAIKPPNGECPFTEDDAQEVYDDRYEFFRKEMNLSKTEAKKRATRSTNAWRQEILQHART